MSLRSIPKTSTSSSPLQTNDLPAVHEEDTPSDVGTRGGRAPAPRSLGGGKCARRAASTLSTSPSISVSACQPPPTPPLLLHAVRSIERILPICGAPGLCVGIIQRGRIAFTKSFGLRDVERKLPLNTDSKFILGSVSKTFLSAAVGVAVEEDRMQFDDLLTKFLPNFDPESDPSIRVSATLSHFLSHRSGLANPQILFCGPESLPLQPEKNFVDFVNAFPTRTLDGQQRLDQHWNYTNAGYALPALALQEVYKCRYSTFVQERILQPLGMTRTAVTRSAAIDDENIAFPYARLSNSSFAKLDSTHITDENNTPILAAMGMRSSVNDLLKWCQFFLSSSSKNPNYFSKSSITATNLDVSTASKASTSFSPSSSSPSSSASTSFSASSSSSFSGSNLRGHQTIMDISFSQIPQIHSCQWTWNPNTPHFSSYCLGWMRTDLPSSKLGKHTYNSAARHPSRKDRSYPPIIGTSSPSRPVFQSCGIMNGAACSISLFPSDECAIVACANGNTDGDAADWATKLLMQALFDLEPKTDFVALAQEEALARQEDYERILGDWRRVGPERRGDTDNGQLISSEYETKDSNAMKSNVQHDTEDVNTMDTSLLPQPFAGLYPISFLDSYSGTYRGLGSTIGITYSSSSDFHLSTLVATFNDIPASRQQLRWHKKDCWSWFPPTRDEWLLRGMIDWDFWATGVFEFVRESTGGKEKSSALLWQWDEGEEATRFERVL